MNNELHILKYKHFSDIMIVFLTGLFLTLVMTLNAISLVFATLVINIKKKGDRFNSPCVPDLVLKICKKFLAKITCTQFMTFYEFYGSCEQELRATRRTLPGHEVRDQSTTNHVVTSIEPTGGVATIRPRSKLKSDLHPKLKKRNNVTTNGVSEQGEINTFVDNPPRDPTYEWFFVAEVLDKSLFLLFLVGMIVTVMTSLVIVPWLHRND